MISSVCIGIMGLLVVCFTAYLVTKSQQFVSSKDWNKVVFTWLLVVVFSIISGALFFGGCLICIAEHTPK